MEDQKYYLQYEDGSLSVSGDLLDCAKSLARYRFNHPDRLVSVVDEDGFIVPSYELKPFTSIIFR